ncbi:hypothetical protein BHM03_00041053, partial [Ensete ventricosum]
WLFARLEHLFPEFHCGALSRVIWLKVISIFPFGKPLTTLYYHFQENHKEKHKKEKRHKDKKEGEKRKDKDQSEDKHREKKDRKEKHKDKKKEKNKDKDGNKISEDGSEIQSQFNNKDKLEVSWKTEEVKPCKFADKLDCWIKNEEKVATTRTLGDFASSIQRSSDVSGSESAMVMERVASNTNIAGSMDSSSRRINGMERQTDNFASSIRSHSEVFGFANAVQKEKNLNNKLISNVSHLGQRGNDGRLQAVDNSRVPIQQRTDGPHTATAVEKENCKHNKVVAIPSSKVQRLFNGMNRSKENLSLLAHGKIDGICLVKTIEDMGEIKNVVTSHIFIEQREEDGIGRSMKDADKRIKGTEKNKDGEAYGRKEKRHEDKDRDKKKKKKKKKRDKYKLDDKEKEEARTGEKGGQTHKERDEIKNNIGKRDQIDSPNLEPVASQRDQKKSDNTHENRKRKELEMNGFSHGEESSLATLYYRCHLLWLWLCYHICFVLTEKDSQLNKFQRTTPSPDLVENGRTVDLSDVACSSIKPEAINNIKARNLPVDIKEHTVNGTRVAHSSPDGLRPPAVVVNANVQDSTKAPHPDSKYLSEIYSLPKIYDVPEYDDQEWLLGSCHCQSTPKLKLSADETPQVWAEAVRIESEDVLALPYVTPF